MHLHVTENSLRIELAAWEKIFALHGSLEIPFTHIRAAHTSPPPTLFKFAWRIGAQIPGVLTLGVFYSTLPGSEAEFWCFRRRRDLLVLELRQTDFARIVLQLPPGQNETWARDLTAALGRPLK